MSFFTNPGPFTVTTPISSNNLTNVTVTTNPNRNGQISLQGDNADVLINGVSLNETLQGIQKRLNILTVNPALEQEWAYLKEIGDQYRKLEAELIEKQKMWTTLKK